MSLRSTENRCCVHRCLLVIVVADSSFCWSELKSRRSAAPLIPETDEPRTDVGVVVSQRGTFPDDEQGVVDVFTDAVRMTRIEGGLIEETQLICSCTHCSCRLSVVLVMRMIHS